LAEHPSVSVSLWAQEGIDRITTGETGPHMCVFQFHGRVGTLTTYPRDHITPERVHGGIRP
jgi:hypothetical protein